MIMNMPPLLFCWGVLLTRVLSPVSSTQYLHMILRSCVRPNCAPRTRHPGHHLSISIPHCQEDDKSAIPSPLLTLLLWLESCHSLRWSLWSCGDECRISVEPSSHRQGLEGHIHAQKQSCRWFEGSDWPAEQNGAKCCCRHVTQALVPRDVRPHPVEQLARNNHDEQLQLNNSRSNMPGSLLAESHQPEQEACAMTQGMHGQEEQMHCLPVSSNYN
ncbi:hypothetical protein GE09DRAFT_71427 [Coniochaeta sp. 2T2.1]|nr:hypothetical protein GE09DRAFT_71427 [Coniochaeta sp. 2T2.1]